MSAHLSEEQLALLIDGVAGAELRREADVHVDTCASCRELLAEVLRGNAAPTLGEAPPGPTQEAGLPKGALIGRYVVLHRLGAGGMGVVYAAYDPELDRRIALKLVRRSKAMGTDGDARLLREAQALAKLTHPNVTTVHDVGPYGDGVFMAMELVPGKTLRAWLDDSKRSWQEILAAFLDAGRGLAAAHRAGLIHRDFKPSNVLVGDDGRIRVADFGLARAASGPPLGSSGSYNFAGGSGEETAIAGTPAYMAPEQQRGEPVSAQSDQYSFCVALYEALYGVRPQPSEQTTVDARPGAPTAHAVPDAPPRPSKVPKRIHRALLRGLAVRPSERFESMDALLASLRWDVRVRRRTALAAIGVGASMLVATAAVVARTLAPAPAVSCAPPAERWDAVWTAATASELRTSFGKAAVPYASDSAAAVDRALSAYRRDWLAMHEEACVAARVRHEQSAELFDLRMDCLNASLERAKAMVAALRDAPDRSVVRSAPKAVGELPPLALCADVRGLRSRAKHPLAPEKKAEADRLRGLLAEARALHATGKRQEALASAKRANEAALALGYAPLTAETQVFLARALIGVVEHDAASAPAHEAAIAAMRAGNFALAAEAWVTLGMAGIIAGDGSNAESERWARYADSMLDLAEGNQVGLRAKIRRLQAIVARLRGDGAAAVRLATEGERLAIEAYGPEHPVVADMIGSRANALGLLGPTPEAIAEQRRALALLEKLDGPDHPDLGNALADLANLLLERGEWAAALREAARAERLMSSAYGPQNPLTALATVSRARAAARVGDAKAALRDVEEAHRALAGTLGPAHAVTLEAEFRVAELARVAGDCRLAARVGEHALQLVARSRGELIEAGPAHEEVGLCHLQQGHYREAKAQLEQAISDFEGTSKHLIGEARFYLAQALWGLGEKGAAKAAAQQAREELSQPRTPRADAVAAEAAQWLAAH